MGVFGKRFPQGPGGQRNADLDSRTLSHGGCDLARTANLRGALLHILQSPMTGLSRSLLEIESASVIGNRERQRASTILQSDADLPRVSMLVAIIDRFLSDAQQFFLDLRRTRARLAGDRDVATRRGCRADSFHELAQSPLQSLNFERGRTQIPDLDPRLPESRVDLFPN